MNQSSITGWWFESLWKILVNGKNDIPYIMENKQCSKPPTIDIWLIIDSLIILKLLRGKFHPIMNQSTRLWNPTFWTKLTIMIILW